MSTEKPADEIAPVFTPPYSPEYNQVIESAIARASSENDNVVRVRHILETMCSLHPDAIHHILGKETLAFPELHDPPPPTPAGKSITFSSEVDRVLSMYGGSMSELVDPLEDQVTIGPVHIAAALFLHPKGPVLDFLNVNGISENGQGYDSAIHLALKKYADEMQRKLIAERLPRRFKSLRAIRQAISAGCFGQDKAVGSIVAAIGAFWGETTQSRHGRPLSFAFIGGPGTGKTTLAKIIREKLAEECGTRTVATIDMTRFACQMLSQDLIGRDSSWRDGGQEGVLTSLAAHGPQSVILIENFDKAHPDAVAHLNTMLNDGTLKDAFTGRNVSFARNVVILTMSQGAEFLASEKYVRTSEANGGSIPRERLIDGITSALEDYKQESASAIADIVGKVDIPVLFHSHGVQSLLKIIDVALDKAVAHIERVYSAHVTCDKDALRRFFVETLQKLDSAHGLEQTVMTALCTELQNAYVNSDSLDISSCTDIKIAVDALPPLEDGVPPPADIDMRTHLRLKQAKRLDYKVAVEQDDSSATIHVTGLKYTIMPSIEDAGWFSVVPANVRISDFVGLERPWLSVQRTINYFKNPSEGDLRPETGMLLYGPPGTGKTSFAKAVAAELRKSFICVNGADFSATANDNRAIRRLHALFSVARRNDAVLFIDEIDAVGNRSSVPAAQAAVINALLTELDGFEERRILVIGATNRLDMLDPALTRAGRLHTLIKVDVLRRAADRERLIDILCAKCGRTMPPALKDFIVRTTDAWAPANIESVVRETFHRAGGAEPTRTNFIAARNAEFEGEETQHRELSDEERRNVAVHEAGHALVSSLYGHKWIQVTVNGGIHALGFLEYLSDGALGMSEKKLRESIDVVVAGRVAESILGTPTEGAESDFRKATDYATRLLCGGFIDSEELAVTPANAVGARDWERIRPRVNALIAERKDHVMKLLTAHKDVLGRVVDELVSKGILFAEDVDALLNRRPAEGETRGGR